MKKTKRKIIQIDEDRCDGCGLCVPACAEGAIRILDGKARLVADKFCDGLGACLGECPNDALQVMEREAEEFDEQAVEAHLQAGGGEGAAVASQERAPGHPQPPREAAPAGPSAPAACPSSGRTDSASSSDHTVPAPSPGRAGPAGQPTMACGCPSTQMRTFAGVKPASTGAGPREAGPAVSALGHWPVQIRLVPPTAPFLKGADLLVLADCVGAAYPDLHQDLLPGKIVMMGCPKFDDAEAYVEKFAQIFRTAGLKSVTVAIMEVPCCGGLYQIVLEAMRAAGASIPLETAVIGVQGNRLERGMRSRSP